MMHTRQVNGKQNPCDCIFGPNDSCLMHFHQHTKAWWLASKLPDLPVTKFITSLHFGQFFLVKKKN
jgi:hypothetical protein